MDGMETADIRPWSSTPEMKLAAARQTAEDLVKRCSGFVREDIDDIAKNIADHGQDHMDGYELAKKLDDRCYWDCDLEVAECLDDFSSYCRNEVERAQKEWFERTKPPQPFPVGAHVAFRKGHERATGTITEIAEHAVACFSIREDGDLEADKSNRRWIIKWEDTSAISETVTPSGMTLPDEPVRSHP